MELNGLVVAPFFLFFVDRKAVEEGIPMEETELVSCSSDGTLILWKKKEEGENVISFRFVLS